MSMCLQHSELVIGSGFSTAYTSGSALLTAARGPSAAYRPKWSVGCLQVPGPVSAYKCPGPVGCLQRPKVSSDRGRVLLTVRRLLTSLGRAEPAAAYSPTAAYKPGPGRAGRCLQSNRCLQAYTGKLMPAPSYRPPRHRLFAARVRRLTLLATEHDAWITGAPGALARLERAG